MSDCFDASSQPLRTFCSLEASCPSFLRNTGELTIGHEPYVRHSTTLPRKNAGVLAARETAHILKIALNFDSIPHNMMAPSGR